MAKFVYLLWHTHSDEALEDGEDVKLIGVYSNKLLAEKALERASKLEGFKEHIGGFEISKHEIDKDEWASGFITC